VRAKLVKAGHAKLLDLLVPRNRKILTDYVEKDHLKYVIPELM